MMMSKFLKWRKDNNIDRIRDQIVNQVEYSYNHWDCDC
jgi:hypothetical protein